MENPDRRRWSLVLLREDGLRAGRWSFSPYAGMAIVIAVGVLVVAVGVAAGLWWADRQEAARMEALTSEVRELRTERNRVRALAARLDSIETAYGRLRRVMGTGASSGGRAVRLPQVAGTEEEATGPSRAEERWRWPLARRGFLTRAFGVGGSSAHPGVDVAVPSGSYIRASRPGVVAEADSDSVYGKYVRLVHGDGVGSLYGHADWLFVASGDSVEGGQVIALSGSTGRSSAPHLHFEVRRDGESVDPARLLREADGGPATLQRQQGGETP